MEKVSEIHETKQLKSKNMNTHKVINSEKETVFEGTVSQCLDVYDARGGVRKGFKIVKK